MHTHLTVRDTIDYTARIRLPPDFAVAERQERVERVLSELELLDHQSKYVHQLSGGQRKRVSIGVELLTDPRVLFLDEPTSGLDPGMEYNMMRIAREIACAGRTVVMTTHAMTNIALCDKLIFLVQGKLAFFGSPRDAMRHFGVRRHEELFEVYKDRTPEEWKKAYLASPHSRPPPVAAGAGPAPAATASAAPAPVDPRHTIRQGRILLERYTALTLSDITNVLSLVVLSPFVIGLGFLGINEVPNVLLMLAVASYWLACQNASKEVVKELPIYRRERMVNLGVLPYIASKVVLLTILAAGQAAVLLAVVMGLKGYGWPVERVYPVLLVTAISGVAAGLLISVAVRTMDQAQTAVPILLICQVVLSGAFQNESRPAGAIAAVTSAVTTYWSYDELKRTVAAREGPTRDEIDGKISRIEDRQDRLKEEMDRVEPERAASQERLDERLSEVERTMSAPGAGGASERLRRIGSTMKDVQSERGELSRHADRIKAIGEERRTLAEELKGHYKKKATAIWFNHLGSPHGNMLWMAVLIAATLLLCLGALKLQDSREA